MKCLRSKKRLKSPDYTTGAGGLAGLGVGNDFHEHAFVRLELRESVFEAD